jgi:hypothetical protein
MTLMQHKSPPGRGYARPLSWAVLALAASAILPTSAQPSLPPGVRGGATTGMATRSVSKYLDLERRFQEALTNGDRKSVQSLLADDFEIRTLPSADSIGADEWLRRELGSHRHDGIVRDLGVREIDDVAVVSFLFEPAPAKGTAHSAPTLFVVDVWRQSSGKLLARYVDRPANPPPRQSRPSGRE